MNQVFEEPFDFKCVECGNNFEVSLAAEKEREFGCPKCNTGWKIKASGSVLKLSRRKD
jgi:DNA-directed RNA polymerase subunit RPC12/RpoP